MRRFAMVVALFAAFGLVAAACGDDDDDDDSSTPEASDSPTDDTADSDDDASGVAGTATVEFAGETYEFTEAGACDIGEPGSADAESNPEARTINATFRDGDSAVTLSVAQSSTGASLTLDGESIPNTGDKIPEVVVTEDGAVYTDERTSGDGLEAMTLSISCS